MKHNVYTMKDLKSCYMQPFVDVNDNVARRNFAAAINRKDTVMNFSPEDYILFRIGEYDDQTGELLTIVPTIVCKGVDVLEV